MLLAVDIGNTKTDFAFFDKGALFKRFSLDSSLKDTFDSLETKFLLLLKAKGLDGVRLEDAIISSVVPPLVRLYSSLIKENYGISARIMGPGLKTGVALHCDNPKEVGADLIADCAGASYLDKLPCIIVDLGTASKIILVSDKGAFEGCAIAPGLGMSRDALSEKTAVLPKVSMQIPPHFLGKNTSDSMNSALTYGSYFALNNLVLEIEKEYGKKCHKVLTGGFASYLEDLFEGYQYEKNLLLYGLYKIAEVNSK